MAIESKKTAKMLGVEKKFKRELEKIIPELVNELGLTGAANQAIAITSDQVTDFSEAVDDRVNVLVSGGANITVTYDDGAGTFVIDNDLTGDVTGVVAGAGLTGGGTSGDVTVNAIGGTGITVNANDIEIDTSVTADLTTSQTLTNKTLTSPIINTGVSGTAILDSDTMSGVSATTLATSESIKAYVDAQTTDEIAEGSSNLYYQNERVDDRVAALIVGGANVTATYDDAAGTLTLDADLAGDVTGVTAGSGMTGGGSSGDLTLNVIGGDGITAAADEITVDSTVVRTSGSQTIAGAKTFSNDVVVTGNFTVNGTTTTVSSSTISVTDT